MKKNILLALCVLDISFFANGYDETQAREKVYDEKKTREKGTITIKFEFNCSDPRYPQDIKFWKEFKVKADRELKSFLTVEPDAYDRDRVSLKTLIGQKAYEEFDFDKPLVIPSYWKYPDGKDVDFDLLNILQKEEVMLLTIKIKENHTYVFRLRHCQKHQNNAEIISMQEKSALVQRGICVEEIPYQ